MESQSEEALATSYTGITDMATIITTQLRTRVPFI